MGTAFWPILLIVGSNILYNIVTKETPAGADPFLSLTITYLTGAAATFVLFLATAADRNPLTAARQLNATSWLLGVVIVGLEVGYLFLYRNGWNVSVGSLTANILLAAALLLVGWLLYHETITIKQLAGAALCVAGLVLLNRK